MAMTKEKLKTTPNDTSIEVDEQPYHLPSNWCWVRMKSILQSLESGKRPKGGVDKIHAGVPSIGGEHLNYNGSFNLEKMRFIPVDFFMQMNKGKINQGDVLIVKDGATTGKSVHVDSNFPFTEAAVNEHVFICRPKDFYSSKLLYYFTVSNYGANAILNQKRGAAQGGINTKFVENVFIPLIPLLEQQRIVDRIESLFEKINKAQELIEVARDDFDKRKEAILAKAFRGELTGYIRNCNEVENNGNIEENVPYSLPNGWKWIKLGELIKNGPQNGIYKPQKAYNHEGKLIVRIDNFYNGVINPWHTLKRLNLSNDELNKYSLKNEDILINRVNSLNYLGKSALVRDLFEPCVFESNMMRLECDIDKVKPEYLITYLQCPTGISELRKNAKHAVNQASINQGDVKSVLVPIMCIEEQNEIVRIVNKLLYEESKINELTFLEDHIEKLKKSILAKAFRGELGTNDPQEESLLNMLKDIIEKKQS